MRRLRRDGHWVLVGVVCGVMAFPPYLFAQSVDLGITDDATYSAAIDAIGKAEYVRYDYVNNPRPRVAGSVAALMEFATRNPLASEAQLTAFVNAYAAALGSAHPGDPELRRGTNFMPALRYTTPLTVAGLEGMDTDVGTAAAALLGMDVPGPFDYLSLQTRTVDFETVRERPLANTGEWLNLLVLGFLGRDLDANDDPAIASVLRAFLEGEGYEPVPDGVDDERFVHVSAGLASLPANHGEYLAAITVPGGAEVPPIWAEIDSSIVTRFHAIAECTDALLNDGVAIGPTLAEGYELYVNDPTILDMRDAELRARRDQYATDRTILAGNTLLMMQSGDPSVRDLGVQAQSLACLQLETGEQAAKWVAWMTIVGGVGTVAGAIASAIGTGGVALGFSIVAAVAGVSGIVTGSIQLANAHGAGPPSAEEQIFNQMIAARMDIADLRTQMNQRFDRIELSLFGVYDDMVTGFNAIGNAIGQLSDTVENLTRDVMINRAVLERIEDALYAMAMDLLLADLQSDANLYLNYRGSVGSDLPYDQVGGAQNFFNGANEFFTLAADTAKTSTFAGPDPSTLSDVDANETLNVTESIGRQVNDLREFPDELVPPLPMLAGSRVVAPGPWAQGAASYVQMARESPWYFAYLYETQTLNEIAGGPIPDIERLINEGQALADMAIAGRSQALFDALFAGYNGAVADLQTAINAEVLLPLGLSDVSGMTALDLFVDPGGQDVQGIATPFGPIPVLPSASAELTLATDPTTDYWGLFLDDEPETASLLYNRPPTPPPAPPTVNVPDVITAGATSPTPTSIQLQFAYAPPTIVGGPALQEAGPFRVLTLALGEPIADAAAFFADTWNDAASGFRDDLLTSANLAGNQYTTTASAFPFDVISDTPGDRVWAEQSKVIPFKDQGTGGDLFGTSVSIDGDTAMVGATWDDAFAPPNDGSATVFTRSGTAWPLEQKLFASSQANAQAGTCVAVQGDTAVMGVPREDHVTGSDQGAVYIFTRADAIWGPPRRIVAGDAQSGDLFGRSVSVDGDTVIVGSPEDAGTRGSAYVFTRTGADWIEQSPKLTASDGATGDRLGTSVSISGDTVIIGGTGNGGSAAYIFTRSGSIWTQQTELIPSSDPADSGFGISVDLDGDTAVIGTFGSSGCKCPGVAYVFTGAGPSWTQQAKLAAIDDPFENADEFGYSVSIEADTIVVGAKSDVNSSGTPGGSAYVFTRSGTTWTQQAKLVASDAAADVFGRAVGVDADSVVVGVPKDDNSSGVDMGAAYFFVRDLNAGSSLEAFITQEFDALWPVVLSNILAEFDPKTATTAVEAAAERLSDWESLIEAYATLSLPFAMETSTILRAVLRSDPVTSEFAIGGDAVEWVFQGMLDGTAPIMPITTVMGDRAAIAQQEINDAIAADPQGHPYLEFMLAELRHLRDHAFDLAVPDAYITPANTPLVVAAIDGLMVNDVDQPCRVIEVDTQWEFDPGYVGPQNGQVSVNADGSFTYTPNPGFVGTDRFTYRTGTDVSGVGCLAGRPATRGLLDLFVNSNPADVVVVVGTQAPACDGDVNNDGMINSQDISYIIFRLGNTGVPGTVDGDANDDGAVNTQDIGYVIFRFGNGCP